MRYLVQRAMQQRREALEANKTAERKTVTIDEMRAILGYDGKGLDHAQILSVIKGEMFHDGIFYSIKK